MRDHKIICTDIALETPRPGDNYFRALYFPVNQKKSRLIWVEGQPPGNKALHLHDLAVMSLVHPKFTFCAIGAAAIYPDPEMLEMVAAGMTKEEVVAKRGLKMPSSAAMRLHYPIVTSLPNNVCLRSWLGDDVVEHCAPGPPLISAEHDVGENGVEPFTHKDFKMADLTMVKTIIQGLLDKESVMTTDEGCSNLFADGEAFMRR